MSDRGQAWRRWFGLVFLALSLGMLVWGQTVLRERLEGVTFLVYWAFCFLFTFLAMLTGMIDLVLVRRRLRRQRRELIRETLRGLEGHEAVDPGRSSEAGEKSPEH